MNHKKREIKHSFFKNMFNNAKKTNKFNNNKINHINNKINHINNDVKVIQKSENINDLIYNQTKSASYFWEYEEEPSIWVSILIPSYNTKEDYLIECMNSIKEQVGHFGIELVWIDDCSTAENTAILVKLLHSIFDTLKHIKIVYQKNRMNRGISFCLHQGVFACSNEIIFRMDSDDIMLNTRIKKQLEFMTNNPSALICGTNIICFHEENGSKHEIERTNHKPSLSWKEYKQNPTDWFLNHPTICLRKRAILDVGNYRKHFRVAFEDLELELRVLKKHGVIYNLQECLLLYRRHPKQITSSIQNIQLNNHLKKLLIQKMIEE
jgi:glycosyltransferase involved in cell wall biosynthesis